MAFIKLRTSAELAAIAGRPDITQVIIDCNDPKMTLTRDQLLQLPTHVRDVRVKAENTQKGKIFHRAAYVGMLFYGDTRYKEACEHFRAALEDDPNNKLYQAYLSLADGAFNFENGKLSAAIVACDQVIAIKPKLIDSYIIAAKACFRMLEHGRAVPYLIRAWQLDPSQKELQQCIAYLLPMWRFLQPLSTKYSEKILQEEGCSICLGESDEKTKVAVTSKWPTKNKELACHAYHPDCLFGWVGRKINPLVEQSDIDPTTLGKIESIHLLEENPEVIPDSPVSHASC